MRALQQLGNRNFHNDEQYRDLMSKTASRFAQLERKEKQENEMDNKLISTEAATIRNVLQNTEAHV